MKHLGRMGRSPPRLLRMFVITPLLVFGTSVPAFAQETVTVTIESNFSPHPVGIRPIQDAWIRELGNAAFSVRVAMYSFTLQAFKNALIAARKRGLDVRIVGDEIGLMRGSSPSCLAVDLYNAGIPIKKYVPRVPGDIVHDKFMLIDDSVLVTGSANFTTAAVQYNHENSLIIKTADETQFIAAYRDQFESMWSDQFGDFDGSFVDWIPEGSCQ